MVPSTSVIPELFHLYFSVRTTTQVFHLVICCLYSVISRDVATCERCWGQTREMWKCFLAEGCSAF